MDQRDVALETLRRVAYLLERQLAETYRVQAFRKAASAIEQLAPDQFDDFVKANQLQTLKGVGAKSDAIVTEALTGAVPEYLQKLEDEPWLPEMSDAALAIRNALKGDCHTHSTWSDGGSSIIEMARTARELGHEYNVITDHSPRLTVANGLSPERLRAQFDELETVNKTFDDYRVLRGIEVDINEDGTLDQIPELLEQLDIVVASVHSKLRMSSAEMTPRMIRAIEDPHSTILGHCTGRKVMGRQRPPSEFDAKAVFQACIDTNTAVEINSRPERTDPPDELLRLAVEMGCTFAIDTDAHAPGQLDFINYGCIRAAFFEIPPERIINTRMLAKR